MKKLLLVALMAIGVSAVSYAQGGPGGGMRGGNPDQQLERLKTQITGITDAQSTKIKAIYVAQAKTQDSLMAAAGDDRMAAFQKLQPIRTANNAKIKAILTAEQATAYQKVLDEQQARMGQGGFGGGAPRN